MTQTNKHLVFKISMSFFVIGFSILCLWAFNIHIFSPGLDGIGLPFFLIFDTVFLFRIWD